MKSMDPKNYFDDIPQDDLKNSNLLQTELQRSFLQKLETKLYHVDKPDPALENDVQVKLKLF